MANFKIGIIGEFDENVENWKNYTERMEQFFVVNEIPNDKKVPALVSLIGGKTYSLLRNLTSPEEPKSKGYDALVELLTNHLLPKPLVIAERFRFHKRDQREGESLNVYVAELRKLTEHCNFGVTLNDALRDRLVCGIRNENIQKRLLSTADLTFAKAIDIATAIDSAAKDASELQQKHRPEPVHIVKKTPAAHKLQSTKPCFRCNRTGHSPDECHFKDAQCHFYGGGLPSGYDFRSLDEHAKKATKRNTSSFPMLTQYLEEAFPSDPKSRDLFLARGLLIWLCHNLGIRLSEGLRAKEEGTSTDVNKGPQEVLYATNTGQFSLRKGFHILCRKNNIPSKVVTGTTRDDYEPGSPGYRDTWNAVLIADKWRLIDPSLSVKTSPGVKPGWVEMEKDGMITRSRECAAPGNELYFNDYWFCTNPREFVYFFYPDNPNDQFLAADDRVKSMKEFLSLPCVFPSYFQKRLEVIRNKSCCLKSDGRKVEVVIQVPKGRASKWSTTYILYVKDTKQMECGLKYITERLVLNARDVTQDTFSFEVRFPVEGVYKLKIYAGEESDKECCCVFKIRCTHKTKDFRKLPIDPGPSGWGFIPKAEKFGLRQPSNTAPKLQIKPLRNREEPETRLGVRQHELTEPGACFLGSTEPETNQMSTKPEIAQNVNLSFDIDPEAIMDTEYNTVIYGSDVVEDEQKALQKHVSTTKDVDNYKLNVNATVPCDGEYALVVEAAESGRGFEPVCSYLLTTLDDGLDEAGDDCVDSGGVDAGDTNGKVDESDVGAGDKDNVEDSNESDIYPADKHADVEEKYVDCGTAKGGMRPVKKIVREKLLQVLESAYPNVQAVEDLVRIVQAEEVVVIDQLTELFRRELIKEIENGFYVRHVFDEITEVHAMKQMPTVMGKQQPTIAIITANYCEKLAVDAMMQKKTTFAKFETRGESKVYTIGYIGDQKVVSAKLPAIGHSRSAQIAAGNTTTRLLGTFQAIKHVFVVGVGGGVPHFTDYFKHPRLGDVIISYCSKSGDIYYYCDKVIEDKDGNIYNTKQYRPKNMFLQSVIDKIREKSLNFAPWKKYIATGLELLSTQEADYNRPPPETDRLTMANGDGNIIERQHPVCPPGHEERKGMPRIHYGVIGAGKRFTTADSMRMDFAQEFGVHAFDSEFDQVLESIFGSAKDSFVFIRGISDYRDGSTNIDWQPYAALAAAAVMKSIIKSFDNPHTSEDEL